MKNSKLLKVSKRALIIILLIIAFSIGIVACGGAENISGSSSGSYTEDSGGTVTVNPETPNPEQPNPEQPTPKPEQQEPQKPTFAENTYYTIYAPFVNWEDKSEVPEANKIKVSWQDTNTVNKIWKKQIEGGKDNDGKRFIIRDANNNQKEPLTGSYYFFDKNFNIVYYRQGKGSLLVRKFINGIIVRKRDNQNWVIGGVYETVLSKNEITANNFDQLNIFMGDRDMGETRGNLEILIINTDYIFDNNTEFGVSFFYSKNNKTGYTASSKITGVRNLSWQPWYVNYKFVSVDPYLWHLEDHSSQKGWKRE